MLLWERALKWRGYRNGWLALMSEATWLSNLSVCLCPISASMKVLLWPHSDIPETCNELNLPQFRSALQNTSLSLFNHLTRNLSCDIHRGVASRMCFALIMRRGWTHSSMSVIVCNCQRPPWASDWAFLKYLVSFSRPSNIITGLTFNFGALHNDSGPTVGLGPFEVLMQISYLPAGFFRLRQFCNLTRLELCQWGGSKTEAYEMSHPEAKILSALHELQVLVRSFTPKFLLL